MHDTRSQQQSPTAVPAGIDPRGPRVAASITSVVLALGLAFVVVGVLGLLTGGTTLGLAAVGLALAAALLNAVFDYCLGCEMDLRLQRLQPAR